MNTGTRTGLSANSAPATVVARRTSLRACRTQSTHWKPTDASTRHSGHAGRSQRVQRNPVCLPG
ncbi:hypothetical protein [Actinokineospora xionganensis]|uniref:hypothetical protein n=1 Tax=Actinokineospora xionganensis TaxID=2684470 RepID=UPI001FE2CA68|nr:hypothetical protein [Actinokineospora xionganensis]